MLRFALLAVIVLSGCDDTLFADDDGGESTTVAADFCGMQGLFDIHCTSCHSAASLLGGLDLETDPYGVLVDQESLAYKGEILVASGDPEASLLYNKMNDSQTDDQGNVMPPEGSLDAQTLQAVYDWIAAGALEECEEVTAATSTL